MARVTIEDCLEVVDNRFTMIAIASKRARKLSMGDSDALVDQDNDKPTVLALREIAEGYTEFGSSQAVEAGLDFAFEEGESQEAIAESAEALAEGATAVDTDVSDTDGKDESTDA